MNDILVLKGSFQQKAGKGFASMASLPTGSFVHEKHLQSLLADLRMTLKFWEENTLPGSALVSVYYTGVVAKSNRIRALLSSNNKDASLSIVGAKYQGNGENAKHIITHNISLDVIKDSTTKLQMCIDLLPALFEDYLHTKYLGSVSSEQLSEITHIEKKNWKNKDIELMKFTQIIADAFYVDHFGIENKSEDEVPDFRDRSIINIYKTNRSAKEMLQQIGIDVSDTNKLDDTTILLLPNEFALLKRQAPWLIAMAVSDLSKISPDQFKQTDSSVISIPDPQNEPTIGVIDTLMDDSVYFGKWVEYHPLMDKDIPSSPEDKTHGTAIDSIIVDGPSFNSELDDGCGRFRVRHFGVMGAGRFHSFTVLKTIQRIVESNQDIKVWNLSLGSAAEIDSNFISPEAAILDEIQYKYDVIFVIAGTNKPAHVKGNMRIGSPADSINALVVNAVDMDGKPASYSRCGPVLSFFGKPDISYYGGDSGKGIRVCTPTGESYFSGTSVAAPWISRKLAFLIHIMGFTREAAKALLIDSAARWGTPVSKSATSILGYGIVPVRIEDVLQCKNNEIRFIVNAFSEKFDTYTYNIPVPVVNGSQPFIAKATMCYFPKCSRNQGVDYTNTEMDLHFGRIKGTTIKSINGNNQCDDNAHGLQEKNVRKYYRKWDNVKHISERDTKKARKLYDEHGMWGLSLKIKERLSSKGDRFPFAVVITLKEINGKNRIDEFVNLCLLRGWLVNKIDISAQIDLHNKVEETVEFDK